MPTYVALLRGINVGGHHKLPMADLRLRFAELGYQNIQTYIQSGNVAFQSAEKDPKTLATQITDAIHSHHGFRPHTILLDSISFHQAANQNPFPQATENPKSLHLFFLDSNPANPDLDSLAAKTSPTEKFQLIDQVFYFYAPDGIGNSKAAASVERALGVQTTARNWNTVLKLKAILDDLT